MAPMPQRKVQVDDAYLGGRTLWWQALVVDRRNKVPVVQPSLVDEAGHPRI